MFTNRLRTASFNNREQTKTQEKEKNWDQRFVLYKIPPYDAFKDMNYLSLGLMKSKIKYERFLEKEKQKKLKGKSPRYTEHYVIDSQTGNKTSKEKNKRYLFNTFNKNNFIENNKNNLAKTYSYKFPSNKNEEKQLTVEENDLIEEFEIIKNMWNKLGVTRVYQENFVNLINSLNEPDNIRLYLSSEKKQMQKFKYELTLLLKKIIHRNDQISSLKQLINLYENILKEKNSHPEKENENLDSLCNINENKITQDIHSCLLSLRITTINVVNQIKSFLMSNSYFLYMDKINLEKIKRDYYYDDEYLFSIKTELDFVQHSVLNKIYEFDSFDGRDPFFLSFSKLKEEGQNNEEKQKNKKIKLEINKKLYEEIQNCIYFMQQSEILHKCKNPNKINNTNKNRVLEFLNFGNNNGEENIKKRSYGIGNLFKGNLEQDIIKLKMTKGYDRIFNFIKTNNSQPKQNEKKENRLKKSSKKKNIPLMTSQELKKKLSQYELLNELINEQNSDNKKEEEFKKRDEEINILKNSQNNKEKKEDSEHENYNKEFEEVKQDRNNKSEEKEEKKDEKDNKENELKKESENNEEKKDENIEQKEETNEKENVDEKNEENEQIETKEKENIEEKEKTETNNEKIEVKEDENNQRHGDSKILEEIDGVIQQDKENNSEVITTYSAKFFTESLDKLSYLYNNYLSTNPNIYTSNIPNKSNDFICGIYPKIIIAEKEKANDDKIYGICGINFYIDENKEYILKINHISVNDNNENILKKFIELIENEIKYKIIEIELVNDDRNENDKLVELLKNKDCKEFFKDDEKIIFRKEIGNNNNEFGSKINYNSLSVISLINRDNNETSEKKIKCFNKVMNPINLSLLIDKLKINNKYKVEMISTSNSKTSLIDNLSKLENKVFDFISSQDNQCDNISELTKDEIKPKNGFYYSMIQNSLKIQMNTLMTVKLDNYLYNGIRINIKNNIIKDSKYNGNLYCLSCNNKNIFIIIYQYNDEFEQNLNKDNNNIYYQFTDLFNISIKNYISEVHNDKDDTNKKVLWIPAFNIDTNLFSSSLEINKYINIINSENVEMKIDEYNEFLKINYLPDDNKDKNVEISLNNSDNDIIIKDKFLFGICHKEFLESCDTPVISLVNVTKDNFKSIK